VSEQSPPVGRLRWRCRRGTTELDRMLGGYLEQDYAQASSALQLAFSDLLEQQDPDIFDWLMGAQAADVEFVDIVQVLRTKYQL